MEGLFNLISESPLLLFFIIAAIISFVRGRGGKPQEKESGGQPKSQGRPTQQRQQTEQRGSSEQEVDWKDLFRQEQRPTEPQPSASNQSRSESTVLSIPRDAEKELIRSNEELQERYEWVETQKKRAKEKGHIIENSPITRNDLTKEKVHLDFSHVSKNEAIKGVIWAEILGKPKARRK